MGGRHAPPFLRGAFPTNSQVNVSGDMLALLSPLWVSYNHNGDAIARLSASVTCASRKQGHWMVVVSRDRRYYGRKWSQYDACFATYERFANASLTEACLNTALRREQFARAPNENLPCAGTELVEERICGSGG